MGGLKERRRRRRQWRRGMIRTITRQCGVPSRVNLPICFMTNAGIVNVRFLGPITRLTISGLRDGLVMRRENTTDIVGWRLNEVTFAMLAPIVTVGERMSMGERREGKVIAFRY